jgi:hypothetical protein
MHPFFSLSGLAGGSSVVLDDRESALAFPRGDLSLGFCRDCGFVCNLAFSPVLADEAARWEDTQGYSGTFNQFQRSLAADLVARHHLHDRKLVEIGCGQGEFLALLCDLGRNRGVGFDPEFVPGRGVIPSGVDVAVRKESFIDDTPSPDADFVCCKMTLEHTPKVDAFVRNLHRALRQSPTAAVYTLVPESLRILRECAFEDIYYEHCSYFTPGSLARLFRSQGLAVERLDVTYGGQYLSVEARPSSSLAVAAPLAAEESRESVAALVESFPQRFSQKSAEWQERVRSRAAAGPVALWGSGSKAVAFMHATGTGDLIEHVVDVNPYRQGRFVACTGQRILAPEELVAIAPGTVVVMNRVYVPEISASLERLGVVTEVIAL